MAQFKKFPHINNLQYFDDVYHKYFITEKLDGSNIGISITEDDIKYYSRNGNIITREKKFLSFNETPDINTNLRELYKYFNAPIIIYGELCGGKNAPMRRVHYGDAKIYMFDIYHMCNYLERPDSFKLFKKFGLDHVPIIHENATIEEVKNLPKCFNSRILNIDNNQAEGYVISCIGKRKLCKIKSTGFEDIQNPSKQKGQKINFRKEFEKLIPNVREERLQLARAKGIPEDELIPYCAKDFVKDFIECHKNSKYDTSNEQFMNNIINMAKYLFQI